MYSTSTNNENGLIPDHLTHTHPPQEVVIEFIPNLSQIEAETELLGNIRTGTPSPPPQSLDTNDTNRYAEWDPSPSPAQDIQNMPTIMQLPGPQESPALTFTNAHGARVSIRLPTPHPSVPSEQQPAAPPQQEASPERNRDQRSSLRVLFQNIHHISQQTTTVLETHQKTHDVFIALEPWYGRLRAMGPDTQFAAAAQGTQVGSPGGSLENDDRNNYDQLPSVLDVLDSEALLRNPQEYVDTLPA